MGQPYGMCGAARGELRGPKALSLEPRIPGLENLARGKTLQEPGLIIPMATRGPEPTSVPSHLACGTSQGLCLRHGSTDYKNMCRVDVGIVAFSHNIDVEGLLFSRPSVCRR